MRNFILGLVALVFMMGVIATGTGNPLVAFIIGGMALFSGSFKKESGALFNNIDPDVSALSAYAGKYSKKIYTKFENSLDFFKDLTVFYNIKSAVNLVKLAVNGKPKPFTGIFNAKSGDIVYSDQQLSVEKWQRDFQIMPDNYRNTYLEELRGAGEGADNMRFPPHVYDVVMNKLAGDINDVVPWHGLGKAAFTAFDPAVAYTVGSRIRYSNNGETGYYEVVTATTAGETPVSAETKFVDESTKAIAEGLGPKLRKLRTDGDISRVASTGVITAADAYQQLKSVWAKAPEWVRRQGGLMFISFTVFEYLLASFEDVSKYTEKDGTLTHLPLTNKKCKLMPVSWITDSDMVVVTPKDNLLAATDLESDYRKIRTIEQMYHLDFGMTGVLGFGVQDPEVISTNDRN